MRYRRKSTEIEAWQYDGDIFTPGLCAGCDDESEPHVHTAHGQPVILTVGDWITEVSHGFCSIRPLVLAENYDAIDLEGHRAMMSAIIDGGSAG